MNKKITNPTVPYIDPVDGGNFHPGQIIRIWGFTPSIAYRFNINLQCGPQTTPQNDVALQVAVHVLDGYISLNSLQNEIWGEKQLGTLPIKRGKEFEVILTCDFNWYKVTIDGQHYREFPQRIHYDRITYLAINGDVSIFQISYESASRGRMGEISGSELGAVLRSSAPVSAIENARDESEVVTTAATALNPEIYPPSFSDSSAPPSYEAALDASTRPPYPTSDPMGMPCPTDSMGSKDFMLYPPAHTTEIHPLPSRRIGIHPPPSAALVMHPPPLDAPVPLNMSSSTVQSEVASEETGFEVLRYVGVVILVIIAIVGFIIKINN